MHRVRVQLEQKHIPFQRVLYDDVCVLRVCVRLSADTCLDRIENELREKTESDGVFITTYRLQTEIASTDFFFCSIQMICTNRIEPWLGLCIGFGINPIAIERMTIGIVIL